MKVRWTARATRDLAEIGRYIRNHNPNAALRVRSAILRAVELARSHPELGRAQTTEGVRKLVITRHDYIAYYMVDALLGEVVVLTIEHAARQRSFEDA